MSKDPQPGFYRTEYPVSGQPVISVLMRRCPGSLKDELLSQLRSLTDAATGKPDAGTAAEGIRLEFSSSLRNCHGSYILVLNEIQSLSDNAVRLLLSNCQRSGIGIAAPRILTQKNRVAETGLLYNAEGRILSPFAGKASDYPGYRRFALCQHMVSLTGPYCFMTSAENLRRNRPKNRPAARPDPVGQMVRFCFRTLESGKSITVLPQIEAVLTAPASRRSHGTHYADLTDPLPDYIRGHPTDPNYTPNCSQDDPYVIV